MVAPVAIKAGLTLAAKAVGKFCARNPDVVLKVGSKVGPAVTDKINKSKIPLNIKPEHSRFIGDMAKTGLEVASRKKRLEP